MFVSSLGSDRLAHKLHGKARLGAATILVTRISVQHER